ncbi:HD-GYP domain-containing protein [Ornithinibacillus halophilus]|uniref:HD-GYP domain, c-di-GMP phosphodiesterase class II (Or its inactivated variant) n=1 Tax=Ornithinibacillus halophilus TaxID=930117 RepID=A0A1M5MVE7_9BACI|nr:HD-GYP domain-containing protein [Ornithinibacillus halophilus]SHG81251.1 HD-GYP domain, c-di-GMP phosphodiesterase class II (or its inactivated variant) [Ornithinibacillus halophilus]
MRVKPSQLVPGCILIRDVIGKTGRPIVPRKAILTKQHIDFLDKFLINQVDVSDKLSNGKPFEPKKLERQKKIQKSDITSYPFEKHYQLVVEAFKKLFQKWQNNIPIEIPLVRKLIVPLIERMEDIGSSIYQLHRFTNKKDYFYHHSVSVAILAAYIGKKLGYEKGEWIQIGLAGFLSDAGMSKLGNIIFKEEELSTAEFQEIKKHPTYSYRMVEHNSLVTTHVKLAVLQHHERLDGSGYPLGLTQGKIHPFAKIISICDMYHAMMSQRTYKESQSPFKVIETLQNEQFSKLDPKVVQTFLQGITDFSIGTKVILSNGEAAEIVFMDSNQPTRPMVKLENSEIISLSNNKELFIKDIVTKTKNG